MNPSTAWGGLFALSTAATSRLYGLGMYGHDANLIPDTSTLSLVHASPVTFSGGFAQAQYWVYPWVIAIMRYDVVNSPTDFFNGVSEHRTRNRLSPGLQILMRANIKWAFEYQYRWREPVPGANFFFRPNGFVTGIDFVM